MIQPEPRLTDSYRVIVACPDPRHELTVTVDAADGDDPAEQACETVFALLDIGHPGVDHLAELGYSPEQVQAVRAWYAHHADLCPGTKWEVITPEGTVRLVCDAFGTAGRATRNPPARVQSGLIGSGSDEGTGARYGAMTTYSVQRREPAPAVPTFSDVLRARLRIRPYLRPTPLYRYPALDQAVGAELWVKHENHQPIGVFKVRGGINLVSRLDDDERRRGVITASTGNHGQSIAYAAALFGVKAVVCMPEDANPVKVESMRALGAEIVFHGRDFDEARERCEELASARGYRYVHAGNEPLLIAGVATQTLEILEEQPDIEAVVVPVGGGSGAAGACVVANAVRPSVEVIGVQSEAAPAAHRSWKARRLLTDRMETVAEGIATRTAFELPQRILWDALDDFVLVSEEKLRDAARLMIAKTRNLVELSGAAPLAAVMHEPARFAGRRVAVICSGGNISLDQLRELLAGR